MPDETPAPAAPINARALLTEVLHIDAKLDAYHARRAELRATLEAEALRRYEAEDAAPSWKVARLGTATLCAADAEPVVNVTDDDAYAEWVMNEHPTEAELVLRIPGPLAAGDQIREIVAVLAQIGVRFDLEPAPAFLAALEATGRADPDTGQLWAADGQVVPGVTVTKKAPYLQIRLGDEAKARARAQLADVLEPPRYTVEGGSADVREFVQGLVDDPAVADAITAGITEDLRDRILNGPWDQVDEGDDDEGAGDAPPPDEGPEHTTTIEVGDPELEQVEVEP